MGGNPTHFGYKRDPADYERAIQQQGAQIQNLTNLFNQFLEAFGINIGPTGEIIILQEMGFIERTEIHNQIVEFIENLFPELEAVAVDDAAEQRPNVWEAYTGS